MSTLGTFNTLPPLLPSTLLLFQAYLPTHELPPTHSSLYQMHPGNMMQGQVLLHVATVTSPVTRWDSIQLYHVVLEVVWLSSRMITVNYC